MVTIRRTISNSSSTATTMIPIIASVYMKQIQSHKNVNENVNKKQQFYAIGLPGTYISLYIQSVISSQI